MEDKDKIKRVIKLVSIAWGAIALILFGLALGRILPLETFQWIFAGGFIIWVVIVTVGTQMMQQ